MAFNFSDIDNTRQSITEEQLSSDNIMDALNLALSEDGYPDEVNIQKSNNYYYFPRISFYLDLTTYQILKKYCVMYNKCPYFQHFINIDAYNPYIYADHYINSDYIVFPGIPCLNKAIFAEKIQLYMNKEYEISNCNISAILAYYSFINNIYANQIMHIDHSPTSFTNIEEKPMIMHIQNGYDFRDYSYGALPKILDKKVLYNKLSKNEWNTFLTSIYYRRHDFQYIRVPMNELYQCIYLPVSLYYTQLTEGNIFHFIELNYKDTTNLTITLAEFISEVLNIMFNNNCKEIKEFVNTNKINF